MTEPRDSITELYPHPKFYFETGWSQIYDPLASASCHCSRPFSNTLYPLQGSTGKELWPKNQSEEKVCENEFMNVKYYSYLKFSIVKECGAKRKLSEIKGVMLALFHKHKRMQSKKSNNIKRLKLCQNK